MRILGVLPEFPFVLGFYVFPQRHILTNVSKMALFVIILFGLDLSRTNYGEDECQDFLSEIISFLNSSFLLASQKPSVLGVWLLQDVRSYKLSEPATNRILKV
jgi:hypothetical protein